MAGVGLWAWDVTNDELRTDARCDEIMAATDASRRRMVFRAAADAEGDFDYEHRLSATDGESRWVRVCGHAQGDAAGHIVRCVGAMREVTDEHRLRESEERLRFVLSATHDGLWELEVASGRVWWSDDMLATLGLAPDRGPRDLEAVLALVHPDDRPLARTGIERIVSGRRSLRRGTVRMRSHDGAWRQIESWAVLDTDPESGEARRLVGIVHDRTGGDPGGRELARRLNDSVLDPLEIAARHVKLAALALGSSPGEAGDLIDVTSVHLARARDGVEQLIQAALLQRSTD